MSSTSVREWNRCIESLSEKTIKERVEAVSILREMVNSPRVVGQLDAEPRHQWLKSLQAMFGLVKNERNVEVSSKGTAAVTKRVNDAAALVAVTITRLHTKLPRKAIKASLNHLTQMIFIQGKLQSFALVYLKALRNVLSYEAHIEHLDEDQWSDIVQLGFAAILGDDVKIGNDFAEEMAMELDDETPRGTALRRGKNDSSDDDLDSFRQGGNSQSRRKSQASQIDIELIGCVEAVFRSTSSKFLTYSAVILAKFVRLFALFNAETSAHLPAIAALNHALSHLSLNDHNSMNTFAPQIWPHLVALWSTKNARLKEQVLVALRYFFPFVSSARQPERSVESSLASLYEVVLSEPTIRWRDGFELNIDNLTLATRQRTDGQMFTRRTFALGQDFTDKHATAWATLELGADALANLHALFENSHSREELEAYPPSGGTQGRAKRRKVHDRLDDLVDSLRSTTIKTSSLCYNAQLLLFVIDSHWSTLHFDLCQRIATTVSSLCSHADANVQSWAFILSAAIAREPFPAPPNSAWAASTSRSRAPLTPAGPDWDLMWSTCMRKLSQAEVCRAAAHAATVLISFERVAPQTLAASIESLALELDVQGPHFPSEAVCTLFEWIITIAEHDVTLFRLALADKVLSWLITAWKPLAGTVRTFSLGQSKQRADPLSVDRLASLIGRICAFERMAELKSEVFVPDCAVASQAIELSDTRPIRDFINANITDDREQSNQSAGAHSGRTLDSLTKSKRTGQEASQRKTHARVLGWLAKIIDSLGANEDELDSTHWTQMSSDAVRRHLDVASFVLLIDGLMKLNGTKHNPVAVKGATVIIDKLAPTLAAKKWSPTERVFILQGLSAILVPLAEYPPVLYPVLLEPGSASGLPSDLIAKSKAKSNEAALDSVEFDLLRLIWDHTPTKLALGEVARSLRQQLDSKSNQQSPPPTQLEGEPPTPRAATQKIDFDEEKDDDFVITDGTKGGSTGVVAERANSRSLGYAVRAAISLALADSSLNRPARVGELIKTMVSLDGDAFISLLETLCAAKRAGLCEWRLAECSAILHHLGTIIMPDYAFARSERVGLVGLKLLECTATSWVLGNSDGSADDWETHAREFLGWYTQRLSQNKLFSWQVRLRLARLMDEYLSIDTTQERWNLDRKIEELNIYPSAVLPFLLADDDFRVRFRAATSSAALFTFLHDNELPDGQLFDDIRKEAGEMQLDRFERTLTSILCSLNIVINSAARRRGPYNLLLQIGASESAYCAVIAAGLEGVVRRLGMSSLAELYSLYTRYLAANRARSTSAAELTTQSPPSLCGFASARDQRAADFAIVGAQVFLKEGKSDTFVSLCRTVKLSVTKGVHAVLAETAALLIVGGLGSNPTADLVQLATEAGASDQQHAEKLINSYADEIGAIILSLLHQDRWSPGPPAALDQLDPSAARVFAELVPIESELFVINTFKPSFDLHAIANSLSWFNSSFHFFREPAPLYSAIHSLLAQIERAPFVDLQRQFLLSLATGIALGYRVVRTFPALLSALAERLIGFLDRVDLLPLVCPMLFWCLKEWLELAERNQQSNTESLSRVIVKAIWACHAFKDDPTQDISPSASTKAVLTLSSRLGPFLERSLGSNSDSRSAAQEAALLSPSPTHEQSTLALSTIKQVLGSSFARLGRFNLARSLCDLPDFASDSAKAELVWRLLESTRQTDQPGLNDCLALAEVVHNAAGEIEPPSLKEMDSLVEARQLSPAVVENEDALKMAILSKLLGAVQSADHSLASNLFDAVRAIFSLPRGSSFYSSKHLSEEAAATADLLRFERLLKPDKLRSVEEHSLKELDADKWIAASKDFAGWVKQFTALLADVRAHDQPFYAQLVPLVSSSASMAAKLLPELVHSLLIAGALKGEHDNSNSLSAYFELILASKSTSIECLSSIVDCAIYLRSHPVPRMTAVDSSPTSSDRWLTVKWINLAQAAVKTGAYLSGLLFLELAHEYNNLFADDSNGNDDQLGQELLYAIYAHVDEPDGFYGRQSKDVRQAVMKRYHHEGRWSEAFGAYGAEFESQSKVGPSGGLVQSLASFGFSRLATSVLQSASAESGAESGLAYELAWRTDTWDLPIEHSAQAKSSVSLYSALKAVRSETDSQALVQAIGDSIKQETAKLAQVSVNWPRPSKEVISTLLALREVTLYPKLVVDDRLESTLAQSMSSVSPEFRFEHAEKMLSTRVSLLRAVRTREQANKLGDALSPLARDAATVEKACLLKLSSLARHTSGQLQTALNSVTLAHKLVATGTVDLDVDHELANVLWAQGEHSTAIQLLRDVQRQQPVPQSATLVQLGEWTAEARLKSSKEISEEYFTPAIEALSYDGALPEERAKVHEAFARFADGEYSEFEQVALERKKRYTAYRARKDKEFEEIEQQLQQSGGSYHSSNAATLDRQRRRGEADLQDDKRLVDEAEATTKFMLWSALENFAHAIKLSQSEHDDKVFRFCALWLANAADDKLHHKLGNLLKAIPSAKFVFLAYQLSARLAKEVQPTSFGKNVRQLVERLATDHPFHVLFAVHALRADASEPQKSRGGRRSSTQTADGALRGRSARAMAANEIFDRVKANPKLAERASAIELACEAYSEWASHDLKRDPKFADDVKGKGVLKKPPTTKGFQIPNSFRLRSKLVDLPIPVSTADLAIDPTATYRAGTYPTLHKYDAYCSTAGGVNIPKIVTCIDSNGVKHKQLLKGGDDIRQDAVMEQAFVLINNLLARDDHSRTRQLHIRTYKVIPLQNRTGLMEFVADTKPIGDVLTALYKKYRPHDLSPYNARKRHAAVQHSPKEDQVKEYKRILSDLPAVMRYAFLDQHKLPSLWFSMRLNYARSLATTSIIGHIVGLGDRHVSNILIDTIKGELVPIDLGIAFDQGRRLPIPELVPFRLTPNLIDGLGMHKIEGVFRHCAQHTLRVLRDQARVLMTVLSVFKHDPLQTWAVSAHVAEKIQGEHAKGAKRGDVLDELPDDADRALAIVAAKLEGGLSVEYRVNQLITEATDPQNLASIFAGWQPCL